MAKTSRKPTPKPLRGDARRNRERLLDVATAAFKRAEGQVSLEVIAKEAGVGIGTLYRHFPTREDLVEAVYLSELDRLLAGGADLLAAEPPDRALRTWMDRFVDWVEGKQGMTETLRAMFAGGALDRSEMQARLIGTIDDFLAAGAGAGVLRSDLDGSDVLRTLIGLVSVGAAAPERSALDRTLDLLVDGLRFNAG
jgi:AcrR family transcriptional regulator